MGAAGTPTTLQSYRHCQWGSYVREVEFIPTFGGLIFRLKLDRRLPKTCYADGISFVTHKMPTLQNVTAGNDLLSAQTKYNLKYLTKCRTGVQKWTRPNVHPNIDC